MGRCVDASSHRRVGVSTHRRVTRQRVHASTQRHVDASTHRHVMSRMGLIQIQPQDGFLGAVMLDATNWKSGCVQNLMSISLDVRMSRRPRCQSGRMDPRTSRRLDVVGTSERPSIPKCRFSFVRLWYSSHCISDKYVLHILIVTSTLSP